jgi:pyruvate/2-oxoglutarate/acetoin dehydrogenase E1 component
MFMPDQTKPDRIKNDRELTLAQAVREALAEEMRRDSRVCIFGEDVAEAGTPFKVLSGLVEEFGSERVIDTPISEAGFTGIGVGAAMTGLRPVVDIMFGDFLTLTMDQMVNQAAKAHYMSGGHWKVPMVMRTTLGATRRSAAQHSQSLHAWFSHIPGLKVVLPSTPYDAKGLLKAAIRDENPRTITSSRSAWPTSSVSAMTSHLSPPAAWCRSRSARRNCSKRKASAPKSSIRVRPGRSTKRPSSPRRKKLRA